MNSGFSTIAMRFLNRNKFLHRLIKGFWLLDVGNVRGIDFK